jgi:hypothetical protein
VRGRDTHLHHFTVPVANVQTYRDDVIAHKQSSGSERLTTKLKDITHQHPGLCSEQYFPPDQ